LYEMMSVLTDRTLRERNAEKTNAFSKLDKE